MTTRTRGHLPPVPFSTVVADPNWGYANFGLAKHGAARSKYAGSTAEILGQVPVAEWTRPASNLFLWATGPKIETAIEVQRAWGYHVVTMAPWVKTVPSKGEIKRGVGFWGYGAAEYLLMCRRGRGVTPNYRDMANKPMMLLCGPRENPCFYQKPLHDQLADTDLTSLAPAAFYNKLGPHSRKPLSLFEWIESYFPGKYLELFARGTREGWTCVGHETGWHMNEEGVIPYVEACERELILPDLKMARRFGASTKIIRQAEKIERENEAKKETA